MVLKYGRSSVTLHRSKMTNRNHNVTLAVGLGFICIVTLLFLLNKTHETLQETKNVLNQLNGKYTSLSKQFDSLYEYKERLEKAFVQMKEEKTNLIVGDEAMRSELAHLKFNQDKLIQSVQDELDACHRRDEIRFINNSPEHKSAKESHVQSNIGERHTARNNHQSPPVPLHLDPIVAELSAPSSSPHVNHIPKPIFVEKPESKDKINAAGERPIKKITSLKSLHAGDVHIALHEMDKEAVQSPIAHVPNLPAQPSGDPNLDPAGNIFV